jgi:hypothetical protein
MREVHALALDDVIYRDLVILSEDTGRGLNGEIAIACGKYVKDNFARLERLAKDKLKNELAAIKEAQRSHDESVVYGADPDSSAPHVVAARERLA